MTDAQTGDPRRRRRVALIVSAAAVVVIAAVSLVAVLTRGSPNRSAAPSHPSAPARPLVTTPSGPTVPLAAQAVPALVGDVMRAVTRSEDGTLLAVGESVTNGVPKVWRYADGRWSRMPGPGDTRLRAAMNGVAAGTGASRYVAVGWTVARSDRISTGAHRHAAIWTSTDGRLWQRLPAPRLGELFDVATRTGGGFVATGVDWSADPRSGNGALLSSPDGVNWTRLDVAGLGGRRPTTLRRLLPGPGATALAIGTRVVGAVTTSGVWTSSDLRTWSEAARLRGLGPAVASAWGLTRLPRGELLVVGAAPNSDGTASPLLWTGRTATVLRPRRAPGDAGAIYSAVASGAATTLVGTRSTTGGLVAAAWTVTVP